MKYKILATIGSGLFLIGVATIQVMILLEPIGVLVGYEGIDEYGDTSIMPFVPSGMYWLFPIVLILSGAGILLYVLLQEHNAKQKEVEHAMS